MAVMKRNGAWYLYFYPFPSEGKIGLKLPEVRKRAEAKAVETMIVRACRTGDFGALDPASREACARMYRNKGWELPPELGGSKRPEEVLTLWDAIRVCLTYPDVRESANRQRHEECFAHIVGKCGKEYPAKRIWIPQIKQYQIDRQNEGAAASTINKEKAALSRMFQVLLELGLHDKNPARLVKGLSERDGRREVYVSASDFNTIVEHLPTWVESIVQALYLTGMRRGEALGLTWENVHLDSRMVYLHAHQTKERQKKRVPIHPLLVPILEEVGKVRSINTDRVFLTNRGRPPSPDSLRNPWRAAVKSVGMDPAPTIHDLRHVWKVNAMRSGMDFEIRETIMGHARGIAGRYGHLSDDDLRSAVDSMSFDRGESQVWVARREKHSGLDDGSERNGNWMVTGASPPKKKGVSRSC